MEKLREVEILGLRKFMKIGTQLSPEEEFTSI